MASISSAGIGSGLDVKSIITQLMAIESQPKDKLAADATKIQSQISEVGKITSAMSALRDVSAKLSSSSFWSQTTASSSNASVTVTSSSSSLAANYSVEVQQLASSQALMSGQTFAASTALVGSGTLNIEMGTWGAGQTSFAPASTPSSASITVDSTDTVESLRDKINAAGIGVSASILSDSSGARLVMRSTGTGADNAFRVTPGGATGGVATLGYDPSSALTGATRTQTASNAMATIDGVSVTSSTSTFTDVLDGVSITAKAVTTEVATVTVGNDTASIKAKLKEFATAYTALNSLIAADTKYDPSTKKAGLLQGDSTIVGLQTRLRSLLGTSSTASAEYSRLSDAGFELQRDGSLTVNETQIDNALSNFGEIQALFINNTSVTSSGEGFGQQFYDATYSVLTTGGSLNSRSTALTDKLTRNQKSQEALTSRLAQTQKMLEAQYGALDTQMASFNGLSSYVTQQVAQWNKTTG